MIGMTKKPMIALAALAAALLGSGVALAQSGTSALKRSTWPPTGPRRRTAPTGRSSPAMWW
jgi:hypothetical protein